MYGTRLGLYETYIIRICSPTEIYTLYNENFDFINELLNNIDMSKVVYFGEGLLKNQYITICDTVKNVGYYQKGNILPINDIPDILGSGIRGVYTPIPVPDSVRFIMLKSYLISNEHILHFFYRCVRHLHLYLNTGLNLEKARTAVNLLLAYGMDPTYDLYNNQYISEIVTVDYMDLLNKSWNYVNMNLVDINEVWPFFPSMPLIPSPITVLLASYGFDSILSRVITEYSVILPNYKPPSVI